MATLLDRSIFTIAKSAANMSGLPQEIFVKRNGSYLFGPRNMISVLGGYIPTTQATFLGIIYPDNYTNIPDNALT